MTAHACTYAQKTVIYNCTELYLLHLPYSILAHVSVPTLKGGEVNLNLVTNCFLV